MDDNWSKQADEIEALSAIFDDQLVIDKENYKKFVVSLSDGEGPRKKYLTIEIELSPDYPSHAPPTYMIKSSSLDFADLERLSYSLKEIYLANMGDPVVYQWLDKAKEFLFKETEISEAVESPPPTDDDGNENNEKYQEYEEDQCAKFENFHQKQQQQQKLKTNDVEDQGVSLPPIHHGNFVKDRKSTFQGHLAPVVDKRQVDLVMEKLKENKKIASATHNIIAYRIDCKNGGFITGCYDDGETHASSRMLHLLEIVDARDVLVVVTRWYGGIHLGPDRFKHINNCTRDLLEQHGYISEKPNTKQAHKNLHNESGSSRSNAKSRKH